MVSSADWFVCSANCAKDASETPPISDRQRIRSAPLMSGNWNFGQCMRGVPCWVDVKTGGRVAFLCSMEGELTADCSNLPGLRRARYQCNCRSKWKQAHHLMARRH